MEATVGSGERAVVTRLRCAAIAAAVFALAAATAPARAGSAATGAEQAASTTDRYEGDWAHRVRPWQRRPVVEVMIDDTGLGEAQRKPTGEPEPCTTFKPSAAQVRAFIGRAKRVSQRDFLHETDWSVCHAVGHVRFQGGVRGEWMVQRLGAGYVSIAGARYYLNCPECALGGAVGGRQP